MGHYEIRPLAEVAEPDSRLGCERHRGNGARIPVTWGAAVTCAQIGFRLLPMRYLSHFFAAPLRNQKAADFCWKSAALIWLRGSALRLVDPAASLQSWLREGALRLIDSASLQKWLGGLATPLADSVASRAYSPREIALFRTGRAGWPRSYDFKSLVLRDYK
jgi:hypothetical protein